MDLWGKCENDMDKPGSKLEELVVDSADFASIVQLSQKMQALHKVWGETPEWKHGGVTNQNIEVASGQKVKLYDGTTLENQNVALLHARGDQYDGPVRGLKLKEKSEQFCGSGVKCNKWEAAEDGKRSGGVLATKETYGPGVYRVRAMVPRTSDDATNGRGYVFAMWTFYYAEIYKHPERDLSGQYVKEEDFPGFSHGSDNDGWHSDHTHEIDFETPGNSPQMKDSWSKNLDWDTMNFNTWLGDNGKYDDGANVYYQQAMSRLPKGQTWISENDEYHDYEIDWQADHANPENNVVIFRFDGKEVFRTKKYVPTRSAHLLVGPWFAWWGSNKQSPNFNTVTVKIAEIQITPYQTQFDFPQTYDPIRVMQNRL
jgi:hypothetical protein